MRRTALQQSLLASCLLGILAVPAAAETDYVAVGGTVTDMEGHLVAGARVVCREPDGAIALSPPTDKQGRFTLAITARSRCVPVAVVVASGHRVALEGLAPVPAVAGTRRDITIDIPLAHQQNGLTPGDVARRFPGADRLFLAFAEDTAMVDNRRYEAQVEIADSDSGDLTVFRGIVAFQFDAIPQAEFGARLGLGDADDGPFMADDSSGPTDTEVWGKLHLGTHGGACTEWAVGAVMTLPTGDEEKGLGFDALRSKLFAAARWTLPWGTISSHFGVRFNEDAEIGIFLLEGETAPAAGVAVVRPLRENLTLVGEAWYEGERFKGGDADARVLAGLNWSLGRAGTIRFAASAGLEDGAPDLQLVAGYAADF